MQQLGVASHARAQASALDNFFQCVTSWPLVVRVLGMRVQLVLLVAMTARTAQKHSAVNSIFIAIIAA